MSSIDGRKRKFDFQLRTKARTYFLRIFDEGEFFDWETKIKEAQGSLEKNDEDIEGEFSKGGNMYAEARVIFDGSTKVLEIGTDTARSKGGSIDAEYDSEQAYSNTNIALYIKSAGISVVNIAPEEVLYCGSQHVGAGVTLRPASMQFWGQVGKFQVDNQLHGVKHPLLLQCIPSDSANPDTPTSPAYVAMMESAADGAMIQRSLSLCFEKLARKDMHYFSMVNVSIVRDLEVRIDDRVVDKLLLFLKNSQFADGSTKVMHTNKRSGARKASQFEIDTTIFRRKKSSVVSKRISGHKRLPGKANTPKIFIMDMRVSDIALRATFSSSPGYHAEALSNIKMLHFTRLPLKMNEVHYENLYRSPEAIAQKLMWAYVRKIIFQLGGIVKSLSIFDTGGDMVGTARDGVRDFMNDPSALHGGTKQIAKSGAGLVGKAGGALGKSIVQITAGDEFLRAHFTARDEYSQKATTFRKGLSQGAYGLSHSIVEGVTGIVRSPVKEVQAVYDRGIAQKVHRRVK